MWRRIIAGRSLWEWGLVLAVGAGLGALVAGYRYLPLPGDWQKLLLLIPFGLVVVILFNNLEKLVLFGMAVSVPLNLDFSLIISPYGRNEVNMASGRTIVALTGLRLSLILIVVMVGYILWLVEGYHTGRKPIRFFASISLPALGLILIAILSVFHAQDVQLAFFKIAQLIELFLVYFYLANHLHTKQEFQFFVLVLVGVLFAESILMITQWFTGWNFSFAGISATMSAGDRRTAGTLGSANTAGGIIVAQLALVCALLGRFTGRRQKIFFGICFMAGCMAVITTASRAAWSSFMAAMAGFMLIGWRRGWISLKSLATLLLIAALLGMIFYPAINARLTEDDHGSAASRLLMYRLSWKVITASVFNFVFGVGANNYALVAPAYNTVVGGSMGYAIQDIAVHNVYLLTWSETGIIGLLCFVWFLAASLWSAWKRIQSRDRFISWMALGLWCALVATSAQMLADPFIARPKIIFTWLLVGLIAGLNYVDLDQNDALAERQIAPPDGN
jgi:O-antigen ligase